MILSFLGKLPLPRAFFETSERNGWETGKCDLIALRLEVAKFSAGQGSELYWTSLCYYRVLFCSLSVIKRVADYVAKSGEVLNLNETSRMKFLEHDSEGGTAENCRTLLCAPVKVYQKYDELADVFLFITHNGLRILGVIVAVNKNKNEDFSAKDKDHFTSLCEFCSLVLSNCQSQKELIRLRVKAKVGNIFIVKLDLTAMLGYNYAYSHEVANTQALWS